jgi:glutamate/aspartate transport system substrate-binding protein
MKPFACWRLFPVLLALAAWLPVVQAQGVTTPTLDRVRANGAIYVGYRESSIPFSYMVGDEVVGYSTELCDRVVDAVRAKLGMPDLKVVRVPVTGFSRVLMLMTGSVDLECGSTTNTKIRQQRMAFSVTTFVSGVKVMVRRDSGIEGIVDLGGKVVVTSSGIATERAVRSALAVRKLPTARIRTTSKHADAFTMVVSRQADAFALDESILLWLMATSPDGGGLKLLEGNVGLEPYAIGLRMGDPDFKKLVDDALAAMMGSGELGRLYEKWFMSPIPPNKVNLRIPMSDMLKEMLRNPSDAGIQ